MAQTEETSSISSPLPKIVEQALLVDYLKNRPAFHRVWQAMVGLLDVAVLVGFIILALSNVFHIKFEEYQVKKALPGLIVGVILANLSFSICLFFVDLIQRLTNLFISTPGDFIQNMVDLYAWTYWIAEIGVVGGGFFGLITGIGWGVMIFGLILFLVPVLILLGVGALLWFRAIVILVLITFSPFAFFFNFFPIQISFITENSKKWFSWFATWLAIGPLIFALFWIAFQFSKSTGRTSTTTQTQTTSSTSEPNQEATGGSSGGQGGATGGSSGGQGGGW